MGDKNSEQSIMDKSMRSVFGKMRKPYIFRKILIVYILSVGNIPYEATEEKLKDIFSEVGPVLSLK